MTESLAGRWWMRAPIAAARRSRVAAAALADGGYLMAWPTGAGAAPPIALLLGLVIGALHPGETFTYSIAVMAVMLVVASAGTGLGVWMLLGYIAGDFVLARHAGGHSFSLDAILHVRIPLLISYILLGMLLVSVPLASTNLRRRASARLTNLAARTTVDLAMQAAIAAGLVFVWTLSVPTLIRPVFTWRGGSPPTEAIRPLQEHGTVLIAIAAIAAIARVTAEIFASASEHARRQALVVSSALRRGRASRPLPEPFRAIATALFLTFMLAGILTSWLDAILFAAAATFIMLLRSLFAQLLAPWARLAARLPVLIRIAAAILLSYALARLVIGMMWNNTSTFRPVIAGTTISLLVFTLLLPESRRAARSRA